MRDKSTRGQKKIPIVMVYGIEMSIHENELLGDMNERNLGEVLVPIQEFMEAGNPEKRHNADRELGDRMHDKKKELPKAEREAIQRLGWLPVQRLSGHRPMLQIPEIRARRQGVHREGRDVLAPYVLGLRSEKIRS